jgi:ribosomal-protein-alanine N-acetyltransferase
MTTPESFQTERLILRAPVLQDARAIFEAYACDSAVTRYLAWRPHRTITDAAEFLTKCFFMRQEKIAFPYAITLRESGKLIGMIEMRFDECRMDIGYVLAAAYWNQGYMTEAVRAVISWGLDQKEIYRVWAYCDTENHPSARVLEKAGMLREGVLRRWMVLPNLSDTPRDCYAYSIVKESSAREGG